MISTCIGIDDKAGINVSRCVIYPMVPFPLGDRCIKYLLSRPNSKPKDWSVLARAL